MTVSVCAYVSMFVSPSPQGWESGSRGKVGVQGVGLLGWRVIRGGGEVPGLRRGSVGWGVVGDGGEGVFK